MASVVPVAAAKPAIEIELTAPNGRKYVQPLGLFINNEFVPSSNGQKLASINPTYASCPSVRKGGIKLTFL
jgi:hypothetical protein